jgi:hydroxyacylglutathione hydrolase
LQLEIIPVTPFQQNCSLLWDETSKVGAVVDPGGDLDRLMGRIESHGIRLEKILVTHGHLDHAGATADLAEALGLPIEGPHRGDSFWIEQIPASAAKYGFPPMRSFTPDRWLEQGDWVTVGPYSFAVLHCPGHTPGHVVFYNQLAKLAFVGDVLFHGSVGRSDFPRGNHEQLIRSIRTRLFPLGDEVQFIPGHGPTSTFGWERKTNPYASDLAAEAAGLA